MRHLIIILFLFTILSCRSRNKVNKSGDSDIIVFIPDFQAGQSTYIYKLKSDFYDKVPVLLSEDKQTIISYPHPNDLKSKDKYLYPTELEGGYWIDNRGINKNVAFLNITYEEYAMLSEPPSLDELNKMILDINPLTELCDCGSRDAFSNVKAQIQSLITNNQLHTTCKTVALE